MTDNKWDDNKIDSLLSSMPDIRDERLESDILKRLEQDERLHLPRRNNFKKWIPVIVAVAALLIFSLIIPSMLQQNDSAMDKAVEPASMKMNQKEMLMDSEEEEDAVAADAGANAETFNAATARMLPESQVLLQEDLQGFQPLQMGLVVDAHTVVPMTLLIPEERIVTDFPKGKPDNVALYNQYAAGTPEAELGFVEMESVTSDSPRPYYRTMMPTGQLYLTPYETGDVLTMVEALLVMKEAQGDGVEVLVPESITYGVQEQKGIAVITFTEPLDLSVMNPGEVGAMIEGFMLTAKSFNKQVRLENVMQDTFLRYDLTTVLPEPVGVNPTHFFE